MRNFDNQNLGCPYHMEQLSTEEHLATSEACLKNDGRGQCLTESNGAPPKKRVLIESRRGRCGATY